MYPFPDLSDSKTHCLLKPQTAATPPEGEAKRRGERKAGGRTCGAATPRSDGRADTCSSVDRCRHLGGGPTRPHGYCKGQLLDWRTAAAQPFRI